MLSSPAQDTISILSTIDQQRCQELVTISSATWEESQAPPLGDIFVLLLLLHRHQTNYTAFKYNCYYFTAVASVAIRSYSPSHIPNLQQTSWRSFFQPRLLLVKVVSTRSINAACQRIVSGFGDKYASQDSSHSSDTQPAPEGKGKQRAL